jgi:glycosyltransferase involved in cell wall biosynthesis
MYPSPDAPDFGTFVADLAAELERRGHELAYVVPSGRGRSRTKHVRMAADAVRLARSFRPDVVYAHFLFPAGAAAAFAARRVGARLVLTAHGRDVRNVGAIPGVATATAASIRRADAVIAVSEFLRRELETKIPDAEGKVHVIDSGVDLARFRHRDPAPLRAELGWERPGTHFLCIGTLDERKNVLRLADAFATLDEGSLVFAGDGPLRGRLEGRERVHLLGRVAHDRVADLIAASDVVCQPSLIEPFGQVVLEALASERPVVATRIGGPAELVTPETGVLVDPGSVESISAGLRAAVALPRPNPAARTIAEEHDVVRQAERVARLLAGEAPE